MSDAQTAPRPKILDRMRIAEGFTPYLAYDTHYADKPLCWVAGEWVTDAIVIYVEEDSTIISTGNRGGRFQPVS
jgi:hypothetical protein